MAVRLPLLLEHIDPAQLTIDANVRADVQFDKTFLASIKEHGVIQSVVVHRSEDAPLLSSSTEMGAGDIYEGPGRFHERKGCPFGRDGRNPGETWLFERMPRDGEARDTPGD